MGLFSKLKKVFKPIEKALKAPFKALVSTIPGGVAILAGHKALTSWKKSAGINFSNTLDKAISPSGLKGGAAGLLKTAAASLGVGASVQASVAQPQPVSDSVGPAHAGQSCMTGYALLDVLRAENDPMIVAAANAVQGSIDAGFPPTVCQNSSGQLEVVGA